MKSINVCFSKFGQLTAVILLAIMMIGLAGCGHKKSPGKEVWVVPGSETNQLKDMWPTVNQQELLAGMALRSTSADKKSLLVFNNKTAKPIEFDWLGYDGKRKKYGIIPALGTYTQETFATHPWLLVDESDKPVALVVSLPGNCYFDIVSPQ